jgi:hypothetical protein
MERKQLLVNLPTGQPWLDSPGEGLAAMAMTPAPCLERSKGPILVLIIQFLQGRGSIEGCPIGHRVIQFLEK